MSLSANPLVAKGLSPSVIQGMAQIRCVSREVWSTQKGGQFKDTPYHHTDARVFRDYDDGMRFQIRITDVNTYPGVEHCDIRRDHDLQVDLEKGEIIRRTMWGASTSESKLSLEEGAVWICQAMGFLLEGGAAHFHKIRYVETVPGFKEHFEVQPGGKEAGIFATLNALHDFMGTLAKDWVPPPPPRQHEFIDDDGLVAALSPGVSAEEWAEL